MILPELEKNSDSITVIKNIMECVKNATESKLTE